MKLIAGKLFPKGGGYTVFWIERNEIRNVNCGRDAERA
jgi:hypothetical protein